MFHCALVHTPDENREPGGVEPPFVDRTSPERLLRDFFLLVQPLAPETPKDISKQAGGRENVNGKGDVGTMETAEAKCEDVPPREAHTTDACADTSTNIACAWMKALWKLTTAPPKKRKGGFSVPHPKAPRQTAGRSISRCMLARATTFVTQNWLTHVQDLRWCSPSPPHHGCAPDLNRKVSHGLWQAGEPGHTWLRHLCRLQCPLPAPIFELKRRWKKFWP